mmetsp:Transcript_17177/g.24865  ORF Transcript_17177/g.24865 Transcript_17177/m.24865 type:complete len:116 (-) Transcript_17177:246-593(-)
MATIGTTNKINPSIPEYPIILQRLLISCGSFLFAMTSKNASNATSPTLCIVLAIIYSNTAKITADPLKQNMNNMWAIHTIAQLPISALRFKLANSISGVDDKYMITVVIEHIAVV